MVNRAQFAALAALLHLSLGVAEAAQETNLGPNGSSDPIETINLHVRAGWTDFDLQPSPPADEGQWCRRVYLDCIGRIPTVDELQQFERDARKRRRTLLIERLLESDEYLQEYTRNWTTIWTNLLIGRTGGSGNNSLIDRRGMQQYLRESFAANKPYNELVYELLSASGSNRVGTPNFNGAVNYLTMKLDEKATLATSHTSQLFLGTQVQCTQCHNHPFNEWKQNQFWEMNAFFRQTRTLRRFQTGTNDLAYVELVDQDFAGENRDPLDAVSYYELRNGLIKVAYPVFVDGTPLSSNSGYLSDVNRRDELAKLVVASPYLSRAIVNRMWAHFLGYGFTKPVDDMGPHNPPSHPELLDYLAERFTYEGHDLKKLIRWIVLSEPYGLSSRTTKANERDDPLAGESPKFTHFYLRQVRAEELYESLLVATQAEKTQSDREQQAQLKARWLRQFATAFGTDEGGESTTFNGTIPQVLMMFNGDLIRQATSTKPGSFLARVAASDRTASEKIRHLYRAGLARSPSKLELRMADKLLAVRQADSPGNRGARQSTASSVDPVTAALQDVWWAVLNCNEFILNH